MWAGREGRGAGRTVRGGEGEDGDGGDPGLLLLPPACLPLSSNLLPQAGDGACGTFGQLKVSSPCRDRRALVRRDRDTGPTPKGWAGKAGEAAHGPG